MHEGPSVEIKVEAFTFTRYGLLHGTVTGLIQDAVFPRNDRKGVDAHNDEKAHQDGQPTYVRVRQEALRDK